jgi:DNA-binding GntR family transcriptional regulator
VTTAAGSGTQAGHAYDRLKQLILSGDIRPGVVYTERQFIDLAGAGRTPAREAILRLAQEGLLSAPTRKGILVPVPSPQELHDVFHMRLLLESEYIRLAVPRIDGREIDAWVQRLQALLHRDLAPWEKMAIDREVHEFFAARSGNALAVSLLDLLINRTHTQWVLSTQIPRRFPRAWTEHLEVFEHVRARNSDGAVQAMRTHLVAALEDLTHLIDRTQAP